MLPSLLIAPPATYASLFTTEVGPKCMLLAPNIAFVDSPPKSIILPAATIFPETSAFTVTCLPAKRRSPSIGALTSIVLANIIAPLTGASTYTVSPKITTSSCTGSWIEI